MIAIDTNTLLLLIIGQVDLRQLEKHKRISMFDRDDYEILLMEIRSFDNLLIIPNVWTEVDNLLNGFSGDLFYKYITIFKTISEKSTEKYLATNDLEIEDFWLRLGVTDLILLKVAKECEMLITIDSKLSDIATANGIKVFDLRKNTSEKLLHRLL